MKTTKNKGFSDDFEDFDELGSEPGNGKKGSKIHVDPDDDFDSNEDLPDDDGKDLPPIIDGDFDELDDDEVEKGFDSRKHYEDFMEDDDDE